MVSFISTPSQIRWHFLSMQYHTALMRPINGCRRIDLYWTRTRRSSSGWEVPSISRKSTSSRWTSVPVQCWSSRTSTILKYWSTAHCPWGTMHTECVGLRSTSFARFVESGNLSRVRLPRNWRRRDGLAIRERREIFVLHYITRSEEKHEKLVMQKRRGIQGILKDCV